MARSPDLKYPDLYKKAFVAHFTDYEVLRNIAGLVSGPYRMHNAESPRLQLEPVADRYRMYATAEAETSEYAETSESAVVAPADAAADTSASESATVAASAPAVDSAKPLVEDMLYTKAFNEMIKPESDDPSKIFAIASRQELRVFLINKYEIAYKKKLIELVKKGSVLFPEYERFSNDQLVDVINKDIPIFGNDAVMTARQAGADALQSASSNLLGKYQDESKKLVDEQTSDIISGMSEVDRSEFETVLDEADELEKELSKLIELKRKEPPKKKIDDMFFSRIRGVIKRESYNTNDPLVRSKALLQIKNILNEYECTSDRLQIPNVLALATFFDTKLQTNPTYSGNTASNKTTLSELVTALKAKIHGPDAQPVPGPSGGAPRNGTSAWSWFWIAQGFAVVVATAVIQSVN